MKSAVLIHGLHVESPLWEELVWGNPEAGLLGRAARGVVEAWQQGADLVFWGTGASEKDSLKESEYTYRLALDRIEQPTPLTCVQDTETLRSYITRSSFCDTKTQNTAQEVKAALEKCREMGIEQLTLVSSPGHVPRCFRDARKSAHAMGFPIRIYATDADTCYPDDDMNNSVIVEAAHRPDRAAPSFHREVSRVFKFYGDPALAHGLASDISRIIDSYDNKLKAA